MFCTGARAEQRGQPRERGGVRAAALVQPPGPRGSHRGPRGRPAGHCQVEHAPVAARHGAHLVGAGDHQD
eukprot:709499-Prorocentrum_minimum.AAC.1